MRPDNLTSPRLIAWAALCAGVLLGGVFHSQTLCPASAGWDSSWPLTSTSEVTLVHWSNLVDALWERQDAAGIPRTDITYDQVTVTGTNTEVVTNVFGSRTVISTNYTLALSTNTVTNDLPRIPTRLILEKIDAGLYAFVGSRWSYAGPWWWDYTNNTLDEWFCRTNAAGEHALYWPYLYGGLIGAETGAAMAGPSHIEQQELGRFSTGVTVTNVYGHVTGYDVYHQRTPACITTRTVLAQAWAHSNSDFGLRWTRSPATNQVDTTQDFLGLVAGSNVYTLYRGTNLPRLEWHYGGTNTIGTAGVDIVVQGWDFTEPARDTWSAADWDFGHLLYMRAGIAETVHVAGTTPVSLTSIWTRVTNIVTATGPIPNIGTNAADLLGADYLQVVYTGSVPVLGEVDVSAAHAPGQQYYIDPLDLNARLYFLDMMRFFGVSQSALTNSSGHSLKGIQYTNYRWFARVTNATWAAAQTNAAAVLLAYPGTSSVALGEWHIATEGYKSSATSYIARITCEAGMAQLWLPPAATNYYYTATLYTLGEQAGYTNYDGNGFNPTAGQYFATARATVGPTNAATVIFGPYPTNAAFVPNWCAPPTAAAWKGTGADSDRLLLALIDFTSTATGGFQYVLDRTYTNIY